MAGLVLALLMMTEAETPSQPNAPVRVEIEGAATFSAEELNRALAARLPHDAPAGTLRVTVRPDGIIELSWQSRRRAVDLGDDKGLAAARVAALLAADLLLPLGLPPESLTIDSPSTPAARAPAEATTSFTDVATTRGTTLQMTAGYQLWSGALQGPLLQGAEVSVGLRRRRLRLQASAAYLLGQGNRMVDLTAWPLRLGAGAGVSYASVLANLVMVPYRMEGLVAVSRALVGLGIEAQARIPLFAGFDLVSSAGFDAYLNRRAEVWAGTTQIFAMPRAAFRFGLGLSWEWAR